MSNPVGRSRPLIVAAAVFLTGCVVGAIAWTAGLTWSLSADGSPPAGALLLIWLAMALVIASGLVAAFVARPILVTRLRNSNQALNRATKTSASVKELASSVDKVAQSLREVPTRAELTTSIEQIQQSVNEVPTRAELTTSIEQVQQSVNEVPTRAELTTSIEQVQQSVNEVPTRAELTTSIEQVQQSVNDNPSRAEIEAQISRARNQIESRLHTQQRGIDRIDRQFSLRTDSPGGAPEEAFSLISGKRPKNVFVLGTGRCGTVTFSEACTHFDNYTSGHESRRSELSAARFAYPSDHIESDNRLSWFLGELGERFDPDETLYVHLTRSAEDVIASYTRRWDSGFRSNIGQAFGHGIVIRKEDWPSTEVESVIRFYVETVTANIQEFLKSRFSMSIQLEAIDMQFPDFIDRVGATGDIAAALGELKVKHNASPGEPDVESSDDGPVPTPGETDSAR